MRAGSIFAGIGGIDLGLERAGFTTRWLVELDPYARAVLARRFPAATLHSDVRRVGAHNLEPVDLLCGGFPCQDISLAGDGAGLAGARSGLWFEYARIIKELRPSYVLIENVSALRSRGLARVLQDLAACGYDAEWDCLPASAFGADHERDRIWVVAYLDGGGELQPKGSEPEQRRRAGDGAGAANAADPDGARREGRSEAGTNGEDARVIFTRDGFTDLPAFSPPGLDGDHKPLLGRGVHGVPRRLDRIKCLGNSVFPNIPEWIGRRILAHAARTQSRVA